MHVADKVCMYVSKGEGEKEGWNAGTDHKIETKLIYSFSSFNSGLEGVADKCIKTLKVRSSVTVHSFRVQKLTVIYRLWVWQISLCDGVYLRVLHNKFLIKVLVSRFCPSAVAFILRCGSVLSKRDYHREEKILPFNYESIV